MTESELINLPFIGLLPLMRLAYSGVELAPLGQKLIEKIEQNPNDANALMDLSMILQLRGNKELALQFQQDAINLQPLYFPPLTTKTPTIRVLALMSVGDLMANSPIEFLLENSDVELIQFYITEPEHLDELLPEHDLLFVAIAESEQNLPLLNQIAPILKSWHCPVLNKPEYITKMSRDAACKLLENVENIVMPTTQRLTAAEIKKTTFSFPMIIRPVDSHAGHDLEKIETQQALENYLNEQNHAEFYIARFVDYRNSDGFFRKYRVMLVEGKPFLAHLAISENWMIHYLNAGMLESAEKRAEEARAMANFSDTFAKKHAAAFQEIYKKSKLDYMGIDCSETPEGDLLIFEIDSCMIVHALDSLELFPYKQTPMHELFTAFQQLLKKTAAHC
ncbi:MAG: RimK family alpha-L-glutamate ligase [Methylococcaceae bacterium]